MREKFYKYRDEITAHKKLAIFFTSEPKGYIGKMVDFALGSAPTTSGQPLK